MECKGVSLMQKEYLYGIIGLLIGIVIMLLTAQNAVNTNNTGMMRMMGIREDNSFRCPMEEEFSQNEESQGMGMRSSMEEMMESMSGKTGDEFDKKFIEAMVVHHQGAIDMANSARERAKHVEIKSLANDIISAQTNEINMMKNWQSQWGY